MVILQNHGFVFCSALHCKRCILATSIPSVCPSVTRRHCVKTTARSTMQFAPLREKFTTQHHIHHQMVGFSRVSRVRVSRVRLGLGLVLGLGLGLGLGLVSVVRI